MGTETREKAEARQGRERAQHEEREEEANRNTDQSGLGRGGARLLGD